MDGLKLNKIAAAILVAGITMMVTGKIAGALYRPVEAEKRGYSVEGMEVATAEGGATQEAAPIDIAPLLASASAAEGEKISKKCTACHSFGQGEANKVGPNLYGVVDNDVASHAGFTYSDAMKAHGGKWDVQSLAQFIHNPKKYVKGTKMTFAGLSNPQDIANIIAYLKQNGN